MTNTQRGLAELLGTFWLVFGGCGSAVLAATGKPLAAPSANASGAISPTRAEHVLASLGGRIPLIVDDGATEAGLESTIVMTGDGVRVLRPGPITGEDIASFFPGEGVPGQPDAPSPGKVKITAPGQLDSHYAPTKSLRININSAEPDEWMIGLGPVAGDDTLSATGDLIEAAANLFSALYRADASPKPRIAIAPVPETGLGIAINDRLRRAAHSD